MLPTLDSELWAHILSFLRRPFPPPKTICEWDELHQHDLAVEMRTCSLFHDAAAYTLYREVMVNHLELFFFGVQNEYPPSDTALRRSKLDNLKLVEKVHIVYAPASRTVDRGAQQPLPSHKSHIYWPSNAPLPKVEEHCGSFVRGVAAYFDMVDQGSTILPSVHTISFGAWGENQENEIVQISLLEDAVDTKLEIYGSGRTWQLDIDCFFHDGADGTAKLESLRNAEGADDAECGDWAKGKVRLCLMSETPRCEACGLDVEEVIS